MHIDIEWPHFYTATLALLSDMYSSQPFLLEKQICGTQCVAWRSLLIVDSQHACACHTFFSLHAVCNGA